MLFVVLCSRNWSKIEQQVQQIVRSNACAFLHLCILYCACTVHTILTLGTVLFPVDGSEQWFTMI